MSILLFAAILFGVAGIILSARGRDGTVAAILAGAFLIAWTFMQADLAHGATPYARWLERSYMPAPRLDALTVRVEDCPGAPGHSCIDLVGRFGIVHLAPAHSRRRDIFLHEVGHLYDLTRLGPRERAYFGDQETLASAWSLCARYRRITVLTSFIPLSGWWPTPREHRKACRVLMP